MARNEGWPPYNEGGGAKRDPAATFVTPDGYLKSGRSLAGPLRPGTAPPVGPKGGAANGDSDFGTDRIAGDFDPMGTSRERSGEYPRASRVRRS